MFKDAGWLGEAERVLRMHLEGALSVSEAHEVLADWIGDHPDVQRGMNVGRAVKKSAMSLRI